MQFLESCAAELALQHSLTCSAEVILPTAALQQADFKLPRLGSRVYRVRKISPKFSCIKFFQIWDVPTQIPGHPGHSVSKTTEKGQLHKVFVRDVPTSGSRMSQEYPAQKLYVQAVFSDLTLGPADSAKKGSSREQGGVWLLLPPRRRHMLRNSATSRDPPYC